MKQPLVFLGVRPRWLYAALLLLTLSLAFRLLTNAPTWECCSLRDAKLRSGIPDVAIVVAAEKGDDSTWLDVFRDWSKFIYIVDDAGAPLAVPANKGREAMVYLTYIVDNYDKLASVVIFSHSQRYQWHNDDIFYDGQALLKRLDVSHIEKEGYVNLRCTWTLGCPVEIRPHAESQAPAPASDPHAHDARAGSFYKDFMEELFPNTPVPDDVGASCCAQFAVTAAKIKERPQEDYQRYRDWLMRTPLRDHLAGRIMEYSWHFMFGKDAVFCPPASDCYCSLYGLCNLQCESEGVCQEAYTLPTYSTLPRGWPDLDWDHNWRNVTKMRLDFERKASRSSLFELSEA